ncbi:hypothetical protein ON010_g9729 [Phytophthora cinnamomi]|nr:hypothetical protein ON010_g9729 [Phytophthora cinnamomi]
MSIDAATGFGEKNCIDTPKLENASNGLNYRTLKQKLQQSTHSSDNIGRRYSYAAHTNRLVTTQTTFAARTRARERRRSAAFRGGGGTRLGRGRGGTARLARRNSGLATSLTRSRGGGVTALALSAGALCRSGGSAASLAGRSSGVTALVLSGGALRRLARARVGVCGAARKRDGSVAWLRARRAALVHRRRASHVATGRGAACKRKRVVTRSRTGRRSRRATQVQTVRALLILAADRRVGAARSRGCVGSRIAALVDGARTLHGTARAAGGDARLAGGAGIAALVDGRRACHGATSGQVVAAAAQSCARLARVRRRGAALVDGRRGVHRRTRDRRLHGGLVRRSRGSGRRQLHAAAVALLNGGDAVHGHSGRDEQREGLPGQHRSHGDCGVNRDEGHEPILETVRQAADFSAGGASVAAVAAAAVQRVSGAAC